jgi:phosphoserine aminotransferase
MGDIKNELKLDGVREFKAEYGELPDLTQTNSDNDIVFTWNGTTSGVKVPNGDWIASDRKGLTFCDATSAVFSMQMPWEKLDVVTYSWQKALGGEGAHGMLILSPRAVERLNTYKPDRPMPKVCVLFFSLFTSLSLHLSLFTSLSLSLSLLDLACKLAFSPLSYLSLIRWFFSPLFPNMEQIFRLTKNGKLSMDVFTGKVINTPSMLAAEDCLDSLNWIEREGGLANAIARSENNLKVLNNFVDAKPWISFLAKDFATRSNTSVCLTLDLPADKVKAMTTLLESEGVAFDIGAYRDAPAGLRIWCGTTVQTSDVRVLCDWLEWAYLKVSA